MDDVEEIKKLKARYFRSLDSKDWELYASVFAEDCVVDLRGTGGELFEGRPAFVDYASNLPFVQSVHHGHMPEIELTGPDSATGVWVLEDTTCGKMAVRTTAGGITSKPMSNAMAAGR